MKIEQGIIHSSIALFSYHLPTLHRLLLLLPPAQLLRASVPPAPLNVQGPAVAANPGVQQGQLLQPTLALQMSRTGRHMEIMMLRMMPATIGTVMALPTM